MKTITFLVIGLVFVSLLLTACGESSPQVSVPQPSSPLTGAVVVEPTKAVETVTPSLSEEKTTNKVMIDLSSLSKKLTNYHYFFKKVVRNSNGIYEEVASYSVYVKDGKTKKVYLAPKPLGGDVYYTDVYLDSVLKTAKAVCAPAGVLCKAHWKEAFKLDYDQEKLLIEPLELMVQSYDVHKIESHLWENHQTTMFEYIDPEGRKSQLYVDNYYGFPLRKVVFSSINGDSDVVQEEIIFSGLDAGGVKTADVTLPEGYSLNQ